MVVERKLRVGLNDHAAIRPGIIGRRRIQRGIRRQTDGRGLFAKARDGVIKIIFSVHVDDIRRPDGTAERGQILCGPGGGARKTGSPFSQ